jgi:hypothetical protein
MYAEMLKKHELTVAQRKKSLQFFAELCTHTAVGELVCPSSSLYREKYRQHPTDIQHNFVDWPTGEREMRKQSEVSFALMFAPPESTKEVKGKESMPLTKKMKFLLNSKVAT